MKAFVIDRNLKSMDELASCLTDKAPIPQPKGNEVVVDVHCAGLNFFDVLQVQGKYQHKPAFPYVAGAEFSGMVSATSPIPKGCHFIAGKTKVFGAGQGSYGEQIAINWSNLIEMPSGLTFEQAAGLFVTYPTSYAALVMRAQLKEGEWCLIHAGAGGVGLAAVQIAKALGAKVIATASTPDKLDIIRREGGLGDEDHAILYTSGSSKPSGQEKGKKPSNEEWQNKVMQITKGKGVDVVYDPVGMLNKSIKVAGWCCRLIVIGFAGGEIEKVPANLILLKNISIIGLHWGAYTPNDAAQIPQVWAAILELIRQGRLRPAVFDAVYAGLESLPRGLADLSARKTWGKAVLRVEQPPPRHSAKL